MSQSEYTLHVESLTAENLRLLQHIDYLESRLTHYENVPAIAQTYAIQHDEPTVDGEWNVWPYSWAAAAWSTTVHRVHSFHENLRRAQSARQKAQLLRHYERALDEGELGLM